METIEAFSAHVISMKVEKAYTGECIYIMTQVLQTKDGLSTPRSYHPKYVY